MRKIRNKAPVLLFLSMAVFTLAIIAVVPCVGANPVSIDAAGANAFAPVYDVGTAAIVAIDDSNSDSVALTSNPLMEGFGLKSATYYLLTKNGSSPSWAPEVAYCVIFETGNSAANSSATLAANNANPANPWVKTPEVVRVTCEIVASANDLANAHGRSIA